MLGLLADWLDPGELTGEGIYPAEWREWCRFAFPTWKHFAPHHARLWEWAEGVIPGERPIPFVGIWNRLGGKTSSAEAIVSYLAEQHRRRFVLWVTHSSDEASRRVSTIQGILERFPGDVGVRLENAYGFSKGWSRNFLRTASGFNLLGVGLEGNVRSLKLDEWRPDVILLEEIDERHDTPAATKKKMEQITETILPAGSQDCAILALQNRIIRDGVFSRILLRKADLLSFRILSGPIPAVYDLKTEEAEHPSEEGVLYQKIVGGRTSWEALALETVQRYILDFGWLAFQRELQHAVDEVPGALWNMKLLDKTRVSEVPRLRTFAIGVDPPAGTETECGIVGAGLGYDRHAYTVLDESMAGEPGSWGRQVVLAYDRMREEFEIDGEGVVVLEMNQGGESNVTVIQTAAKALHEEGDRGSSSVPVVRIWASQGKRARAEPVQQQFTEHRAHHYGHFPELEGELTSWLPSSKESPNRLDAEVWAVAQVLGLDLSRGRSTRRTSVAIGGGQAA